MRRRLLGLSLAALLVAGAPVRANDVLLATFRDYLEALRLQTAIPGLSAAIIGRDDVLWMHAYGRQDLESGLPTAINTPFHLDGLTQIFTTTLLLRCAEAGLLSLSDPVGQWVPDAPEPRLTIAELLAHTSTVAGEVTFVYNTDRMTPLAGVVESACGTGSFRETLATHYELLGMADSVPGPDVLQLDPFTDSVAAPSRLERYQFVLSRLATPYTIDAERRPIPSLHATTTLTPAIGAIGTVQDYAKFDLALKRGELVGLDALALSWVPPVSHGLPLPHALGWFVQTFNGEQIVWQFGVSDSGSSSMVMMAPGRGLTLILLANSPGLVRPFALDKGDLVASPFGRLFLGMLVR